MRWQAESCWRNTPASTSWWSSATKLPLHRQPQMLLLLRSCRKNFHLVLAVLVLAVLVLAVLVLAELVLVLMLGVLKEGEVQVERVVPKKKSSRTFQLGARSTKLSQPNFTRLQKVAPASLTPVVALVVAVVGLTVVVATSTAETPTSTTAATRPTAEIHPKGNGPLHLLPQLQIRSKYPAGLCAENPTSVGKTTNRKAGACTSVHCVPRNCKVFQGCRCMLPVAWATRAQLATRPLTALVAPTQMIYLSTMMMMMMMMMMMVMLVSLLVLVLVPPRMSALAMIMAIVMMPTTTMATVAMAQPPIPLTTLTDGTIQGMAATIAATSTPPTAKLVLAARWQRAAVTLTSTTADQGKENATEKNQERGKGRARARRMLAKQDCSPTS
jgi:hypothetical protein